MFEAAGGIARPVIDRFHAELVKVFDQPDVRRQLGETLGMDFAVRSPAALQEFIFADIARWGKVARKNNVRGD